MSDAPALPNPSSEFLLRLGQYPDTPTRELLEPYLSYELWLRKAFKRDGTTLDGLANLVPVYRGHQDSFRVRNIDRQIADKSKYIMLLPKDEESVNGHLAITTSLEEYNNNFNAFTHGVLNNLDWSNVVVAGSSALHPLLPIRKDIELPDDGSVQDPLEAYYQLAAKSSDIDLFLYGMNSEEEARTFISQIEAQIRRNQRLFSGGAISLRSENAITLISPRYPYRHVQIILRLYKSISEILTGFDVDCACVAFDGENVYTNPRGITAIATRTNTIDLTRRSPSYENRLYKYRRHNFDVYWTSLERSRIDPCRCSIDTFDDSRQLTGLARLIFFEERIRNYNSWRLTKYQRERRDKKIEDAGEPMLTLPSGYARHEVPYGERFTANRVREYIEKHSNEPYLFGTIHQVIWEGAPSDQASAKLRGPVNFIKDNPGRQMIGSFHPLDEEGWTEIAYRSTYSNVEGPPREDSLYDQSSGDESNTGPTRGWKFLCC